MEVWAGNAVECLAFNELSCGRTSESKTDSGGLAGEGSGNVTVKAWVIHLTCRIKNPWEKTSTSVGQ